MNIATRLELTLQTAVSAAMADLTAADLQALWIALEPMLSRLPDAEQLRIGGRMIAELAEVCQLKAERLLCDWEEQHNQTGPAITDDLLAGLVQQTMYLEISDLVRQPHPPHPCRLGSSQKSGQKSRVDVIEKSELLALLATQELNDPLTVAHQEQPSVWIEAVANWMQAANLAGAVSLLELQQSLNMPLVELWLALLLGGYRLESRGGFYESEQIWVKVAE